MKKKIVALLSVMLISLVLVSCGNKKVEADYSTEDAETALNNGDDLEGKTVEITVDKYVPDGALGYTIQTGERLNFVSSDNPKVKEGETIIVKVKKTTSTMGSFIMTFDKQ